MGNFKGAATIQEHPLLARVRYLNSVNFILTKCKAVCRLIIKYSIKLCSNGPEINGTLTVLHFSLPLLSRYKFYWQWKIVLKRVYYCKIWHGRCVKAYLKILNKSHLLSTWIDKTFSHIDLLYKILDSNTCFTPI